MKKLIWSFLLTSGLICSLLFSIFVFDLQLKSAVPVQMPFFSMTTDEFSWNKLGNVDAKGTWIMEKPDVMYTPFLANEISCDKKDGFCTDAEASITSFWGTNYLRVNVDRFPIVKW